jgi:hypothetical protein
MTPFSGTNQAQRAVPPCSAHELNLMTGDNFAAHKAVASASANPEATQFGCVHSRTPVSRFN